MGLRSTGHQRVSAEFEELVRYIKARYMLAGKKPPSNKEITKKITKILLSRKSKEELVRNEFIKF